MGYLARVGHRGVASTFTEYHIWLSEGYREQLCELESNEEVSQYIQQF